MLHASLNTKKNFPPIIIRLATNYKIDLTLIATKPTKCSTQCIPMYNLLIQ